MNPLREDLNIIQQWIKPNSKVLDLGCGAGVLLKYLKEHKNVHGYGLEISPEKITACIQKRVNVIEQDLGQGSANFQNTGRDSVVMTHALRSVQRPDLLLDEMLRIGNEAIITSRTSGYGRTRFYLTLKGR